MASSESRPLPPVPSEILIALDQTSQRDELDSFVLAGGVTSVEDILNELIPDGTIFPPHHTAQADSVPDTIDRSGTS